MDTIIELEKHVIKNPKKSKPEDLYLLARHYWALATGTDDYREKRKHLKRSSYFVDFAFKAGADAVEQLELYRTILQHAAEVSTWPEDERRKLSKIIARWLEKTGGAQQEVLKRARGKIIVEGGTISLGDRARVSPSGESIYTSDKEMVEWVNRGERLTFATGGDGLFKAELRLIDATEPVLTAKEYKKLRTSTPTVVIDVSSGALGMADFAHFFDEPWDKKKVDGTVCLDIPPGRYKACAYGFSTPAGYESVIGVVTATSDEARNETKTVDSLFG